MNEILGEVDCPSCGKPCDVKQSKKNKPYINCSGDEGCGYQGFARGEVACNNLRNKMRPKSSPAPDVKPDPVPTPKPKKGFLDEFFES